MYYQMEILKDKQERKNGPVLKNLLAGYLRMFDKQPEISQRLKTDSLIESDLFFLRGYCSRVSNYRDEKFSFKRVD